MHLENFELKAHCFKLLRLSAENRFFFLEAYTPILVIRSAIRSEKRSACKEQCFGAFAIARKSSPPDTLRTGTRNPFLSGRHTHGRK